jgi:IS6 family transposase
MQQRRRNGRRWVLGTLKVVIAGHAFIQNVRRGHYELGVEANQRLRVRAAFAELTQTI